MRIKIFLIRIHFINFEAGDNLKFRSEERIILIYVLLGVTWITVSDRIANFLIKNFSLNVNLELYKGWFYVIITGIIFYKILHSAFKNLRDKEIKLRKKYEQLEANNEEITAMNKEIEESYKELDRITENLEKVIDLTTNINKKGLENETAFLTSLFKTAVNLIEEADYGSVYKFEDNKINFITTRGHNLKKLQQANISPDIFDKTKDKVTVIKNIVDYSLTNMTNKEKQKKFAKASKEIKESLTFGLFYNNKRIAGISLDIKNGSDKSFDKKAIKTMEAFKSIASSFYILERYKNMQQKFQEEIIISMLNMLEIHDVYTKGHSQNVASLAYGIAKKMELNQNELRNTYWAGMVHDIGKTLIPENILNKKGKLTELEYEEIKLHPLWGYQTLKSSSKLKNIADYVLYHHERWDGDGYPEGISQKKIPLISRILAVADAWDAMTSDRSYRNALSIKKAKDELIENKKSQFDPEVVDIFLNHLEEIVEKKEKIEL